jgi:hypothetical protein
MGVRPAQHVFRDGRLTDLNAELEQLPVDARSSPERVGKAHLTDQFACLRVHGFAPIGTANASRAESLGGATGPQWRASPAPSFRGNAATAGRATPRPDDPRSTTANARLVDD